MIEAKTNSFKDIPYITEQDLEGLSTGKSEGLLDKLGKLVTYFNYITKNLSLSKNFTSYIVDLTFSAGEEKTISHLLGVRPKYRIILRQEGNGVLSDIPSGWNDKVAVIKNNGAVAVTATVMFLKEQGMSVFNPYDNAANSWAQERAKQKQSQESLIQKENNLHLDRYIQGNRDFVVGGNARERTGALEGLTRGALLYGQNMPQTGDKIQKAANLYEKRLDGGDPVTEALRQQRNESRANVARNVAGRGVGGVAAAAAQEEAMRQKDIDIAASAYAQNQQNLKDYTNLHSNIAANQGMLEQVYRGNAIAGVELKPVQNQGGLLQQLFG